MVGVRGFEAPAPVSRRQFFLLGLTINQPHTHSDSACMWLKTTQTDWNGQMLVTFWAQWRGIPSPQHLDIYLTQNKRWRSNSPLIGLRTITGARRQVRNQWCGMRARCSSCICWLLMNLLVNVFWRQLLCIRVQGISSSIESRDWEWQILG